MAHGGDQVVDPLFVVPEFVDDATYWGDEVTVKVVDWVDGAVRVGCH